MNRKDVLALLAWSIDERIGRSKYGKSEWFRRTQTKALRAVTSETGRHLDSFAWPERSCGLLLVLGSAVVTPKASVRFDNAGNSVSLMQPRAYPIDTVPPS